MSAFEGLVTYVLKRTYFYNKVFAFEVGAFLSYLVFDLSLKGKTNAQLYFDRAFTYFALSLGFFKKTYSNEILFHEKSLTLNELTP